MMARLKVKWEITHTLYSQHISKMRKGKGVCTHLEGRPSESAQCLTSGPEKVVKSACGRENVAKAPLSSALRVVSSHQLRYHASYGSYRFEKRLEKEMQARSGNPALHNGLLFGMLLGIFEVVLYLLFGTLGLMISLLLFLFLVGYAGYRASASTGKVSTGGVAGVLVGLLSSVTASIPLLLSILSNRDAIRVQVQQQIAGNSMYQGVTVTNALVLASVILFLVVVVAGATLLGLAVGSLGGVLGKRQASSLPVPQSPSFLPPYPPQGYAPPLPQAYQPLSPPLDYTSPEAYMLPQEHTPPHLRRNQGP